MSRTRRWKKRFFGVTEPVDGNNVRLLQSGAEFFPALIAAVDAAQVEIHLETYIFHPDATGRRVFDALVRAARRGVQVKLLIDGVGSRDWPDAWRRELTEAGGYVLVYRPLVLGRLIHPHSLRRLHRKLAVIDARTAFVGGINVIDDFEPVRFDSPRLDFSVEVRGPLLAQIHPNMRRLWRIVALSQLQRRERRVGVPPTWPTDGHIRAAFVVRDNFAHRRDIERNYLVALALAREEILIGSAYFLPGRRFRTLLKKAATRGVRISLLVQGHTDHAVFQAASHALYSDLLASGVNIYELRTCELHAKAAVVDGHWATVGSSNIDPFSLLLAREANIVVDDDGFGRELRERLIEACGQAIALDPAHWERRGRLRRLASWLAYGWVRLIAGLVGAGRWV